MDTGAVMDPASIATIPVVPRSTRIAWRLAPLADRRRVDVLLRIFGAKVLPFGVNQGRLVAMGLPSDVTELSLIHI